MTLILTHISKFGIIHATDSNLTWDSGKQADPGRKLFAVEHLKAALTVAGSYSVGGEQLDTWMQSFIQKQADSGLMSLEGFARKLATDLESQMLPEEKHGGSIIHLAGYVKTQDSYHPEFYHIRNVHGIDPHTGEYCDLTDRFEMGEDFWTRDCPRSNLMQAFQHGVYQLYINGFASGRISYMVLQQMMTEFLSRIWANPNWRFRPPQSLAETEVLVKLYMQVVSSLFLISDYEAPVIGGDIQTYLIPQPVNTLATC